MCLSINELETKCGDDISKTRTQRLPVRILDRTNEGGVVRWSGGLSLVSKPARLLLV